MTKTFGETLIDLLEIQGVDTVFGIPGIHTAELYRGLAGSSIRHVTPRHEQAAAFMADGYARSSGKPGVCIVITGPGLTNALTAMAQAREDSIPMLILSGVNARRTLGAGKGHLHELPDQRGLSEKVTKLSITVMDPAELASAIERAFMVMTSGRPGPVHIEIPTDVMFERVPEPRSARVTPIRPRADQDAIEQAAKLLSAAKRPVILAGGGALGAADGLKTIAEKLDAPVVQTTNARGLMAGHPLNVPASPSMKAVRTLVAESDIALAVGTQLSPTDYDIYQDDGFPELSSLVRIDIDHHQLAAGPRCMIALLSDANSALVDLEPHLTHRSGEGTARADAARKAAGHELSDSQKMQVDVIDAIFKAADDVTIVGDSTQPVYAGNFFCNVPGPGRWFNSSTGFGALGYAAPAAIGASIARPERLTICLTGDGGLQFSLAELGTSVDEKTAVIFVVWNNQGYREIKDYMKETGIEPLGVSPSPPKLDAMASAYGLYYQCASNRQELVKHLQSLAAAGRPAILEFHVAD